MESEGAATEPARSERGDEPTEDTAQPASQSDVENNAGNDGGGAEVGGGRQSSEEPPCEVGSPSSHASSANEDEEEEPRTLEPAGEKGDAGLSDNNPQPAAVGAPGNPSDEGSAVTPPSAEGGADNVDEEEPRTEESAEREDDAQGAADEAPEKGAGAAAEVQGENTPSSVSGAEDATPRSISGSLFGFLSRISGQPRAGGGAPGKRPGDGEPANQDGDAVPDADAAAVDVTVEGKDGKATSATGDAPEAGESEAQQLGEDSGSGVTPTGATAGATATTDGRTAVRPRRAAYHDFVDKLRQPGAGEVVRMIKDFVQAFMDRRIPGLEEAQRREAETASQSHARVAEEEGVPDPLMHPGSLAVSGRFASGVGGTAAATATSRAVIGFLGRVEATMRSLPLWQDCSAEDWDAYRESLEKFVLTKIHKAVFAASPEEREADARLRERILALSFVSFDELDIREVGEEFRPSWEFAANELRKMNGFRTPRDKLVCVLNCCRVLTNLLASSRGDDNPPGADELLPALILTVIRANPDHMHSNLNFIAQFRHPGKLVSEPGYFFTHVLSAVTFIETIHADALSLGEDEFARRVQDASARHGVDPAPILGRARLQGRRDSVDSVTAAERMREARARATSEEMEGEGAPHSDTGATASEGQTRGEDGPGSSSSSSSAGPARGNEERGGDAGRAGALARAAHDAVSQLGSSPPPLVPAISSSAERELTLWRSRRYRFVSASAEDLRVGELSSLLKEYKHLAATCERLLKERQRVAAAGQAGSAAGAGHDAAPSTPQRAVAAAMSSIDADAAAGRS